VLVKGKKITAHYWNVVHYHKWLVPA